MSHFRFNDLLRASGCDPSKTRLLRHSDTRNSRTPYALWRDDLAGFDRYQSVQKRTLRAHFSGGSWAAFVVSPAQETLFVGVYDVGSPGEIPANWVDPLDKRPHDWSLYDLYPLTVSEKLREYVGRIVIDWGLAARSWTQLAANQDKPILELRKEFLEPAFPGFTELITQLSEIERLPLGWKTALSATRGIYLLTCPRTLEQYVGKASGREGFFGRWRSYLYTGDGGNAGLKSRDPSDYQISILQVAGTADDDQTLNDMEVLWKKKLQSREMGLNRN